jgi:hypothetical protein
MVTSLYHGTASYAYDLNHKLLGIPGLNHIHNLWHNSPISSHVREALTVRIMKSKRRPYGILGDPP